MNKRLLTFWVTIGILAMGTMASLAGMSGVYAEEVPVLETSSQAKPDKKIVINIPSRTLWLYEGEKIVRWYPVGVGRPGFPTPVGKYKVIRKVVNPGWEHPYQAKGKAVRIAPGTTNNPLGTRWIGFHEYKGGEYGMHGTDRPSSVGKYSSHGCVRMKIKDAEDLFDRVEVGVPVEVTYETVLIRPQGSELRVVVYPDALKRGKPSLEQIQAKIRESHPNATIDPAALKAALQAGQEKPVVVGTLPIEPASIAQP